MRHIYRIIRSLFNPIFYKISPSSFFANMREAQRTPFIDVTIEGHTIRFNPQNYYEWSYFKNIATKEEDTSKWIESFENDSVFFDVGANIGLYTILAMMRHNKIKVLSFEPECQNFNRLIANLHTSKLGRATAYCMGLSSDESLSYLNQTDPNTMGRSSGATSSPSVHGLLTTSLDKIVEKTGLNPNYIKIDVDGIEEQVLQGAQKTLRDQRLQSVLVEVRDESYESCVNLMLDAGFTIKSIHPRNLNHIFIRESV